MLKAVIVLRFDETHIVVNDYYQDFGARSVAPTIALKRQHGEFVPDLKAMRQPAPSLSDLCDMKEEFTKYGPFDGIYSAPPEVTDEVLQQLYNGQAKFARRYLNYCWPRHRPGKADYWRALMARVKESEYWPAVARLNRLPR